MKKNLVGALSVFEGFFFFCFNIQAQVIQIGSGNSVNNVNQASPVNIYYRRTVCQFVYTVAEINAAGKLTGDSIKEIGFRIYAKPLYDLPSYTIKMKHTNQSNVNTSLGAGGWTVVKGPFTFSPQTGEWNMIVLDQPFLWNGTQNIAIEICWSQVQPTWDPSGQLYIYTATNGFRYSWTDAAGSSCGQIPATRVNYKPQIRMKFKDYSTWLGTVSSDWFNPANWNAGVPNPVWNAVIPAGTPFSPVISGQKAKVRRLTLQNGATLSIAGSDTLEIYHDFTCYGNLIQNKSTIHFKGLGLNQLSLNGTKNFYNLAVHKNNGITITGGMLNIINRFDVKASVVNTNGNITLLSTDTGTARMPRVGNSCKYVIQMNDSWGDGWNGGYLSLYIDGELDRTYFAKTSQTIDTFYVPDGSTFNLTYTAGQYENENSFSLYNPSNVLIYSAGPPIPTGNIYSATSSCATVNPIVGNIVIERRIQAGATNWRFLTIPVQNGTLQQWYDDFIMSGFPGSHWPNWPSSSNPWPSVYFYDETVAGTQDNGFYPPSNITNTVAPAQGLWVWCGDTITGTQPFTIDVVGSPYVGPVNFNVTYTNSGLPAEDGWNMVANPYACPIDWDSPNWTKLNIDNAIYIWNPQNQQFASYVAGVGVNGGSRYIASSQAFWVKANAASPVLIANEFVKHVNEVSFIKATAPTDYLKLEVTQSGLSDELVVRFDDSATINFDSQYDALKMASVTGGVPYFASVWNGNDYSINTLSPTQAIALPLKYLTSTSGMTTLQLVEWNGLKFVACAYLHDHITNVWIDLKQNSSYTFMAYDTTTNARFTLHISMMPEVVVNHPSCSYSADGEYIYNHSSLLDSVKVYHNNALVYSSAYLYMDTVYNLTAGTYVAKYYVNDWCGEMVDTFVVDAPPAVVALFAAPDTVLITNAGVQFNNLSQQASYYYWDFGDGNSSSDYAPLHTYALPGAYYVTLMASNLNQCTDTFGKWVHVLPSVMGIENDGNNDIKILWIPGGVHLQSANILTTDVPVHIYDVVGKLLYSTVAVHGKPLDVVYHHAVRGVYLISIGNRKIKWVNR